MKMRTTLISFLFFLCHSLPALAAPHEILALSKIDAVTVFADRAQVSRSATLLLKPGSSLVTFQGLPQLLSEDSVRVEGEGTRPVRITGITVKKVFLERVQEKRVHELQDEITALNRKVESIDARRKALQSQKAFIESIRVGWGERISKELAVGKPTAAELREAVTFVGDGIGKIEEELYDAESARKPLTDRIAALKNELEQSRVEAMKEVRSVQAAIDADSDTRVTLRLSYMVSQAHWSPTYDVRLAKDGQEAELGYRALVWQQTGEDWSNVKLALSTASPEVGGAPPELTPWYVSFWEPPRPVAEENQPLPPYAMKVGGRADGAMPKTGRGVPEEAPMAPAIPETAQIAEGQSSVLFNVRQPADVPADGTQASSLIAVQKVPVTAEYVTTPKLSTRVYLKSVVTDSTPYPLLAGQVSVFNDASFTGKSWLKNIAPGEKFDLFFGADDQIKVKRDVAKVRKDAGLLSGNSISYHCSIEVENYKSRAVAVSVLDQLPVPQDSEIKVKLEEASPKPDESKRDGTMLWKLKLAAGEKKRIGYDIVIEYPKDRPIIGAY
jgi:uncharacterized protein (TIGR02231 family)